MSLLAPRRQLLKTTTRVVDADARHDPTGTGFLRRRFAADLDRRWARLKRLTIEAVGKSDILGLGGPTVATIAALPHGNKVEGFRSWFDAALRAVILVYDGRWTRSYIEQSMQLAKTRAQKLTVRDAYDPDELRDPKGKWTSGVDLTETKEFKSWFGGSKVVNESGKPLVMYQGGGSSSSGKHGNMLGNGIYVTNSSEYADKFTGREGYITPLYVKAEKILEENSVRLSGKKLGDYAIAHGYDAIRGVIGRWLFQLVVFDPTQIKSAIGNKGTFDPKSPKIGDSAGHRQRHEEAEIPEGLYEKTAELVAKAAIDHGVECPWLAGRSRDGSVVYIDERVPRYLPKTGIDTWKTLPWHELAEWSEQNAGRSYDDDGTSAHPIATAVERRRVIELGGDWDEYSDEMAGYVEKTKQFNPDLVPENLDKRPFLSGAGGGAVLRRLDKRAIEDAYDPDEPRDPHGRWTSGGEYPLAPRSEWYGEANYEATGGKMVTMSPDAFLKASRPLDIDETSRENIDFLKEHIEAGKTLDPLALYANGKEDGRHRAMAAKELGIKRVPVINFRKTVAADTQLRDAAEGVTLASLTVAELSGICDAVGQQAVRAVATGILHRERPALIARRVGLVINSVGRARSRQMAGYMIVKAFSVATLEEFRARGVTKVGTRAERLRIVKGPHGKHLVKDRDVRKEEGPTPEEIEAAEESEETLQELESVEILTAGDDDVCDICEEISDNGPYDIDEAMSLIPAHPGPCRCAFVPANDARFANVRDYATGQYGGELYDFDPDQPRGPAGSPGGGEWSGGGFAGGQRAGSAGEAEKAAGTTAAGHAKLSGLPDKSIDLGAAGFYAPGPNAQIHAAAVKYMQDAGLHYDPPKSYEKVDKERAARIAGAFDAMPHAPDDPAVQASYAALARETLAQWQAVKATGLKVEWIKPGQKDPYAASPRLAALDVAQNNHWWGFPTDQGFGSGEEAEAAKHNNPMLTQTDEVVDGRKLVVNDVFRIVHDYFGHFKDGVGFRAEGEDNAWRSHVAMFSDAAKGAMTSETRGQNSWVNFGPYGEANRKSTAADTHYAPQKIGLMPDWTWKSQ